MAAPERLTAAQAVVRFLKAQYTERDGEETRAVPAMFGIFGHGNVAGIGQALEEFGEGLPFFGSKNEQSMVHTALGFAKARNRRATLACSASIGPGSTNMLTGAATATTNRLPVLLLPSDVFANRRPGTVLQQLEHPSEADCSINDAFRPLSRFFDRISRPEQLLTALPEAMRILFDPAETGAVTLSLPQDVQGEAGDFPSAFFERRIWHMRRSPPAEDEIERAAAAIRAAKRPLAIAGGGVRYSGAEAALVAFCNRLGAPVMETFAGKGVAQGAELHLGGGGTTGTGAAAHVARSADLVLHVGCRMSDFTTASRSAFRPEATTVGINVLAADATKLGAMPVVADARLALEALAERVGSARTAEEYRAEVAGVTARWWEAYDASVSHRQGEPLSQGGIVRAVNRAARKGDVVVAAAGTPAGEIMKAWDNANGSACYLEYAFSCMGHEIPAGMGVALARANRGHVFVVIGDGTYLMQPSELVTAVSEGVKMTVVVIENGGYQCIRALQKATTGADNFGNEFRRRSPNGRHPDGDLAAVDYAANARSMGCEANDVETPERLAEALAQARDFRGTSVVVAHAERGGGSAGSGLWWDVGVAQVSGLERVRTAFDAHERERKARQTTYLPG